MSERLDELRRIAERALQPGVRWRRYHAVVVPETDGWVDMLREHRIAGCHHDRDAEHIAAFDPHTALALLDETIDALLARVHARIGLGFKIQTFVDGSVELSWRRSYVGAWSDERYVSAATIADALRAVLRYEDEADAREQQES